MRLRAIFQDIDGCLNPADGELISAVPGESLSPAQVEMIHQISDAVDASSVEHFILNTGRPLNLISEILNHLRTPKARYQLLEHACVLYDRELGQSLDCRAIAEANGLQDLAERYSQLEAFDAVFRWYREVGQAIFEEIYQASLPALEKVANLSIAIPENADGGIFLNQIKEKMIQEFDISDLQFLRSDRFIDILPGIDKLDGIHLLCAHLGIDFDECLAVGDYLNDLPVFEAFHRVMCPANAHPQIKELARSKGVNGCVSSEAYGPALLGYLEALP